MSGTALPGDDGIRFKSLSMRETVESGKNRVYISDGQSEVRFTVFEKGVYYSGLQSVIDVVNKDRTYFNNLGLTDSALNIMISVSENEGNLDAINTWDNSFLSFGMFQWTVGADNDPGELAALLSKIKTADSSLFHNYFGQYGLDIIPEDEVSSYFSLDGKKLATEGDKEKLRTNGWAFTFWKAGQDKQIQAIEIEHAFSRIGVFYKSPSYKIGNYYIEDLISSEYGVALVLDNHVNRPGYVKGSITNAVQQTGLLNPASWGTTQELQLITEYLKVRATYGSSPMTNADERAGVTKSFLDKGTISDERGSFKYT